MTKQELETQLEISEHMRTLLERSFARARGDLKKAREALTGLRAQVRWRDNRTATERARYEAERKRVRELEIALEAAETVGSMFATCSMPTRLHESPELVTMQARAGGADGGLVRIEVHPQALHVRLIVSENVVAGVRATAAKQLRRMGWTVDVFAVAADSLGWRAR